MNVLLFVIGLIGTLYGAWFAVIAVIGSFKKRAKAAPAAPKTRFAVIVPARNEEGVVGHLVKSLVNQEYPKDMFDVIVVPNGCTDLTAETARLAGAEVLPCTEETHSKGDVLRFAFAKLQDAGRYDAYCILDADNLAAPGFLRAANAAMLSGCEICQGYRDSKNPGDNWVAGDTSIFFWVMDRFYNRSRAVLGMSAALNGTGIIISAALIRRVGWDVCTLTEDLEFSGICAANGVKIGFAEDAVVYDEQPVKLSDSMSQRRRWFSGTMQCLRGLFVPLVKARTLHAFDMLFIFCGCVTQVLCLIPGVVTVYRVLSGLIDGSITFGFVAALAAAAGIGAYAACALFALLVIKLEKKPVRRMLSSILMFPIFLVTWLPANLWAMVTPPPKWKQIAHVRGTDSPV